MRTSQKISALAVPLSALALAICASPASAMHVIGATVSGPSDNQTALVTIDGQPMPETLRAAEVRFGKPTSIAQKPGNSKLCMLLCALTQNSPLLLMKSPQV
jgi:hypothetical protein